MTHQPGQQITIASYNSIVTSLNTIFGTGNGDSGYGGNSTNVALANLVNKATGTVITNEDWLVLRNAQDNIAAHQGVALSAALPPVTDLEDTDIIQAFEDQTGPDNPAGEIDSAANLAQIVTNKNLSGGAGLAIAAITTSGFPSVRSTPWSSFIEHVFTVDFGSADNARFFFNTGGQIKLDADRTGGSGTPQNANWDGILAIGPFVFDRAGYFALGTVFSSAGPGGRNTSSAYGAYGTNSWTISSRRDDAAGPNGGNGSIIRFQSSFLDGHTNVFADQVDGTFTSIIEERRSAGVFVRPTPTFTTIKNLTDGF